VDTFLSGFFLLKREVKRELFTFLLKWMCVFKNKKQKGKVSFFKKFILFFNI
jgi:hypothetical protein